MDDLGVLAVRDKKRVRDRRGRIFLTATDGRQNRVCIATEDVLAVSGLPNAINVLRELEVLSRQ